jgi:hypothetical protein
MGGDPERDESGLPPIDIEIPDDARELDREVHAYYRELRAQRRRRRFERVVAPFTRHGMMVPMVAGTLALTLFAGIMLTVITSAPETPSSVPTPIISSPAVSIPAAGQLGGLLPTGAVLVGNKPTRLRDLSPAVLAIIPPVCRCLLTLEQLTGQAVAAQVKIYFVGAGAAVKQLAQRAGNGTVLVVEDPQNVLAKYYHPAGLTAILVHTDAAVTTVDRELPPGFKLQDKLSRLAMPGLGYPDSPSAG